MIGGAGGSKQLDGRLLAVRGSGDGPLGGWSVLRGVGLARECANPNFCVFLPIFRYLELREVFGIQVSFVPV